MSGRQFGFSPTDLSGCVLWLRADLGTIIDEAGKVSQWNDQSGNNNHVTQVTGSNRPRLSSKESPINRSAIVFDGINDFMQSGAFTLVQPETVFMVHECTPVGVVSTNDIVFDGRPTASMACGSTTGPTFTISANTSLTYASFVGNAVYAMACMVYNGAASSIRVNRAVVALGTVTEGASPANGVSLGGLAPSGTRNSFLRLAEFIVFNRVLTTVETNMVEMYLSTRHNIAVVA